MSKIDQKSDPFPELPRRGLFADVAPGEALRLQAEPLVAEEYRSFPGGSLPGASDPFPLARATIRAAMGGLKDQVRRAGKRGRLSGVPVAPLSEPAETELEKALRILLPRSSAVESSEGGVGAHAADSRMSRSASASRPVTGGKEPVRDGNPAPIGPQEGTQSLPSGAISGGPVDEFSVGVTIDGGRVAVSRPGRSAVGLPGPEAKGRGRARTASEDAPPPLPAGKGRGRPKKAEPRPWELMEPPVSRTEYYRRKKAGTI